MKKALIIGITGQDGSYLAELLLEKGYEVHGILRRSSSFNTGRIDHIFDKLKLHYGDVTDLSSLISVMVSVGPDEIYNLAAQSHVAVSFEMPIYTGQVDALGTLNVLEAARLTRIRTRIYQASSSEMFGSSPGPQNEMTPFQPCSPYGAAKVYAYHICKNYRESYGMHISNGILFNHESPRRGGTFVTKKIANHVANNKILHLGNLNACRDWGHAKDYVRAMWLMLQQETPDDYVIATGQTWSVREFVEHAYAEVGTKIEWELGGHMGDTEYGYSTKTGLVVVTTDSKYLRPKEVPYLLGQAVKAEIKLGWKPEITFKELVKEMVEYELKSK